ncbi:MAG: CPBP family intramembrane metalloprotease, partial [Planctomycetaceae bacterium]|nr:CPBP family intramembrane metalloprotease [Planctomycetaceae bacterium]
GITPSQGDLPELLDGITKDTPTVYLLLILAVAPALGEELIFRGVIGRGLVARFGIFGGILATSVMFSAVHGNPVQGIGVFFVGVMCHVAYLSTRTLAAPILLHFLNNTLPVMALKSLALQNPDGPMKAADEMATSVSPWIAIAAMLCVAVLGCLLWLTRVQFRDLDGLVIDEFPPGVEAPAEAAMIEHRPVPLFWFPLAGATYLLFLVTTSLSAPAM